MKNLANCPHSTPINCPSSTMPPFALLYTITTSIYKEGMGTKVGNEATIRRWLPAILGPKWVWPSMNPVYKHKPRNIPSASLCHKLSPFPSAFGSAPNLFSSRRARRALRVLTYTTRPCTYYLMRTLYSLEALKYKLKRELLS